MNASVEVRIVRRDKKATCECGHITTAQDDGSYKVSTHLQEVHGFSDQIDFTKTFEVICPPMIGMTATDRKGTLC